MDWYIFCALESFYMWGWTKINVSAHFQRIITVSLFQPQLDVIYMAFKTPRIFHVSKSSCECHLSFQHSIYLKSVYPCSWFGLMFVEQWSQTGVFPGAARFPTAPCRTTTTYQTSVWWAWCRQPTRCVHKGSTAGQPHWSAPISNAPLRHPPFKDMLH